MERFLEAGQIINTHGVNGELKIQPWCDNVEFLLKLDTIYIDGAAKKVVSSRKHKNFALIKLDGIENIDMAEKLKNKIILIDRKQVSLPENSYFISDVIGFDALDKRTGKNIGKIIDIITLPSSEVYVISDNRNETLIPAVPEFVKEVDMEKKIMHVHTIEGMINCDKD